MTPGIEMHKLKDTLYLTDIDYICPFEITRPFDTQGDNLESEIGLETDLQEIHFLPIKMVLDSKEETIDEAFRRVSSLSKLKCDECDLYIPDKEYYLYQKTILVNANEHDKLKEKFWIKKVVSSSSCCLRCYREKALYHKLKHPVKKYKKKNFRLNTIGTYYIHTETG